MIETRNHSKDLRGTISHHEQKLPKTHSIIIPQIYAVGVQLGVEIIEMMMMMMKGDGE